MERTILDVKFNDSTGLILILRYFLKFYTSNDTYINKIHFKFARHAEEIE